MRNFNKIYLTMLLTGISLLSCKKDFLDVTPIAVTNGGSFYQSKQDAEQAVTAVYAMLCENAAWDKYILADLGSIASDDAEGGGESPGDTPSMQDPDRFTFTPGETDVFTYTYGALYKGVFMANVALENLPNITKKDTSATPAFIKIRIAEVKFLRALYFFYLTQIYGEVPTFSKVLGSSQYNMGRSPMRLTYDQIEKDLTDAIADLPLTNDEVGRANKGAAMGLLAKVYLFESSYAANYKNDNNSIVNPGQSRFKDLKERWQDAYNMATGLEGLGGKYKLVGIDGEKYSTWRGANTDGFRYVWTTSGENSPETVFEIQNCMDGKGWPTTRGSAMENWTCARYIYVPGTTTKTASNYWGFNIPSHQLLNEFNKEPGDPRFNTSIHIDSVGCNDSIQITGNKWARICYTNSLTKMYQCKYECSYAEFKGITDDWTRAPFNVRILRYSDVLLIAAEAAIKLGDNSNALKYLNMVRKRARMCGVPGNTIPVDLTGTVTMDQLIHDRRLELALEGHRFFDLVRWNLANKYLNQTLSDGTVVTFTPVKNDFFPIPQQEVNLSKGGIKQYAGW